MKKPTPPPAPALSTFKGLSAREVTGRRPKFGYNELPYSKGKSIWHIGWEVIKEPMFILLVACASLYIILGDVKEGAVLMVQVLVVIAIMFYQERKTEKALSAIRNLSSPKAFVVRDGHALRIEGREVIVGDTIILQEGDRIPADAKILENNNLSIDESLLTGESVPVHKSVWKRDAKQELGGESTPFIYSGTMIVQGKGFAEVLATGINTEIGKIGKSLDDVKEAKTLLQAEIRQLVIVFSLAGAAVFTVAVVTFGILRGDWLKGLLAGLSVAMSMLPEEFPVVLTIFMALGAWRMSRKHILARRMATIETLGSATVLCTDKTGTITQNKMQVEQLLIKDQAWIHAQDNTLPEAFDELLSYAMLAGQLDPFDPMEKAILATGKSLFKATDLPSAKWRLLKEYPLSKDLLVMSRVFTTSTSKDYTVAAKGSPEAIMKLCHLKGAELKTFTQTLKETAEKGLRILGVAKAEIGNHTKSTLPEKQDAYKFEFLGFVAMSDPIRKEVPQAIKECYTAGIRVMMITGDYAATAQQIAREIGLANPEAIVSGEELAAMSDAELKTSVKTINIFTRVAPAQKLRLVEALKANGEVVAMTGDGVNDAPALKSAHIGIAMGQKGTDVARETASLVLLDDNFASIVIAIKMGRRIFDNLQKAMIYIFAVHIPVISISIVPMLTTSLPLMLLPIHIAFMELIIDPACSIVFEAEEAEADIMKRPPRLLGERFFSFHKIRLGIFQGLGLSIAVFAVYIGGLLMHYEEGIIRGMTFVCLLIGNLCLILTNRSLHKTIFKSFRTQKNGTEVWIILAVLALSVAVVYVPFVADLFKIKQLPLLDFFIAFTVGICSIVWFEIVKVLHKPKQFRTKRGAVPLAVSK